MKIKTLALSLAAVGAAFAEATVSSQNMLGMMKVSCSAEKVIICTPWVKTATAGEIALKDLVMTSGLSDGDAIILYDTSTSAYKGWKLQDGAWVGMSVSDVGGTVAAGSNETIARGEAFWFVKGDFGTGAGQVSSYDVYLYGQDSTNAVTSTIVEGSVTTPAYSLLASPKTTAADLNAATFSATPSTNDIIQVASTAATNPPTIYTYNATQAGWGTTQKVADNGVDRNNNPLYKLEWTKGCTIPAGAGFWYISKGGSGTITW